MLRVSRGRLRAARLCSLCLAVWLGCCPAAFSLPQADEQEAIRRLALKYFAAYQREDFEGMMSLWSAKSPDAATARQSLRRIFANMDKLVVNVVRLGQPTIAQDKARIRLDVEISGVEAKTGKPPTSGFGKLHRTLELVKEGGEWKIWRLVVSEQELAAALVAATTDEERKTLLAAENELLTVELQRSLLEQGYRLSIHGSYARALAIYQFAMRIAEQLGDTRGISAALNLTGVTNYEQGNYTQALDYYQKALRLAEESGYKLGIGNAVSNIGNVHFALGNYAQALDYYQKALRLDEESGNKASTGYTLSNIGNIYLSQGDYAQALDYYQKALRLAEEIGNPAIFGNAVNNIGVVYSFQGDYTQALEYYRKRLKQAEEAGDKAGIGTVLGNIANIHFSQGNNREALEYYEKRLKLAEEIGDKTGTAITLLNLGYFYNSQGKYTQALEYYRRSLKLAEETGDKASITNALNNMGVTYRLQGNYTQAIELADRAADLASQTGRPELFRLARDTAGQAYRALNRPDQARLAFLDAISTIEKLRGQVAGGEQEEQRFFEDKLSPYYQMIGLLIAQNNQAEALRYSERAKGRVLLDVLRSGRVNITKAMTAEERVRERQLNSALVSLNSQLYRENFRQPSDPSRLSELNTQLQRARLEYESFQTGLYAAHPELKARRGETPPLTLNEAAQLLPADGKTALLEYSVADDKSFLFVLTRATTARNQGASAVVLKAYPLNIKSKELSDMVETFQKQLGERNLAFSPQAQRFYELLLKPAEGQLRGKETLCIVPDGILWQLPFQALKPTAGRYLIEDYAIFYAPSLTTLREMLNPGKRSNAGRALPQQTASPSLLAFGNPMLDPRTVTRQQAVYRDEELGSLPEAEREVNALRQLYGAARSRVYVGSAAREERVKAEIGNYRVVHFATHGILDNRSPLYSHLLLAQEPGNSAEDGLLEAREIMEMDLQAELIVLSACQTAGGRVGAGEGVIGMTWALFVAGCPATLVSQWKVDTRSTSRLMVEFHGNLQRQRRRPSVVRKAEALRQAMLTLLRSEEYELPYYWAPFVLIGNGF
jgi:CHAT domain-containing protein/tetratricopeptide (TPR) repeat protein